MDDMIRNKVHINEHFDIAIQFLSLVLKYLKHNFVPANNTTMVTTENYHCGCQCHIIDSQATEKRHTMQSTVDCTTKKV